MLLETGMGDAYGAGFEFVDQEFVDRNNDLSRYYPHPKHEIRPGNYTDDTQMSIAIAEAVLEDRVWTPAGVAQRFVTAYHRDPRPGYSKRIENALRQARDGEHFLSIITPDSSASGAAMRAAPIGVYRDLNEVIERCRLQARITHDTSDGTDAAIAVAAASHYMLYRLGPKARLGAFLDRIVPGRGWSTPWRGRVSGAGLDCVRAALTALMAESTLSPILRAAIAFGGDVDTVGAIAMAIASTSAEIEHDLPGHLLRDLEHGRYGREFLRGLDDRLRAIVDIGLKS